MSKTINLRDKLKEIFGYNQFRGNQETIIQNILSGRNTFVIMPTGAGKSLCYQLPALISEGVAIVISPLIALMKNQVDQLNTIGVNAQFLNSTLNKAEITKVKQDLQNGKIRLLYVAPESLTKEENVQFLRGIKISFIAIDEAHCISEWGHDFRPEYRKIKNIVEQIGKFPIIALTATATPKVQQDIQRNLQMEEADVFKSSFNRSNLFYEVRPKVNTRKQLIKFIKRYKGKSGIIYCLSRKKVEEIAEFLKVNDIKAVPYHAGLESHVRMENQDAFLNEDVDVVVATIAFGMGIDKPDVRFVVHYDTPKSLEGYYQETGRAGRDGLEGYCLMFFSMEDIQKLEKFNKDKNVSERDNARHLLQEMEAYAHTSVCRRKQLLHYFGEKYNENECDKCDNCHKKAPEFESKEQVLLLLKAVTLTEQRFGVEHLIDVVRGVENDYVISYEHNKLDVFGKGSEIEEKDWLSIARQSMIFGYLDRDIENYGIIKISEKGKNFLARPSAIRFYKDHDFMVEEVEIEENETVQAKPYDEVLFDMLKKLRKKVAKQKGYPPFVIFQDPSMEEIATVYPITIEDLAQVNGVGMAKARKFGKPFVDMIAKYVEENDITTAADVVVKSTINKSKTKIFIIQQIDRKIDLEEIAQARDLGLEELIDEIEHICYSGTKLNLDYYLDQILDEERQQIIYDYFMEAETDSIDIAMGELEEEDFTEEEIRLMRIKFLSELAL